MSDSVCNFVSGKSYSGSIKPVHFVYETEFHSLRQPFFHATFSMYLVTKGVGTLRYPNADYPLKEGDLFFSFPSVLYRLDASDDFTYMYISFMGDGCHSLLDELGICPASPVYPDFGHLLAFWQDAIHRKEQTNISLLTESLLLYTLSFIRPVKTAEAVSGDAFVKIVDYVDKHFRDPELSLGEIARQFSYTDKYLSSLFSKNMNMTFKKYLNTLRLQYAYKLIENGETSVTYIAEQSGYTSPLYFSKVFKAKRGKTPRDYIKEKG